MYLTNKLTRQILNQDIIIIENFSAFSLKNIAKMFRAIIYTLIKWY